MCIFHILKGLIVMGLLISTKYDHNVTIWSDEAYDMNSTYNLYLGVGVFFKVISI